MARTPDGLLRPGAGDERLQLAHVRTDLEREFPAVPPEVVDLEVSRQEHAFTNAPIRSFVPVLVRRLAREQLRHFA